MADETREKIGDLTTDLAAKRTDLATERTDMALTRTVMAADRTLMSWVRTCLAMLTFGFTAYKFLVALVDLENDAGIAVASQDSANTMGIVLVSLGILSMVLGLIEYYIIYRRYSKPYHQKLWGYTFIIGILTAALGVFLLVSIFLKL